MSTIRQEQIQNSLVHEISSMLQRDLKDPRLGFITITGADVSRDLRHARVFVSVMGSETERTESLAALRRAAGLIRGEFARRAHLRVAPEIAFDYDEGIARGARILELLHQVETAPGSSEATAPAAAPSATEPGVPAGEAAVKPRRSKRAPASSSRGSHSASGARRNPQDAT